MARTFVDIFQSFVASAKQAGAVLWRVTNSSVGRTTIVILIVAGAVLYVSAYSSDKNLNDSVVKEWNDNIARLGIEPVYPPQEDIDVGDVFISSIIDRSPDKEKNPPLLGRSIKISHINMTDLITKTLANAYMFPDTTPRPASGIAIWKQDNAASFDKLARNSIPIVLFPGLSIARASDKVLSLGGLLKSVAARIGMAQSERESTDLKIPMAETYGVDSLDASAKLVDFCYPDGKKNPVCLDQFARNQLSMIVGCSAFLLNSQKTRYRFDLQVMLISRVYMARAIDITDNREAGAVAGASTDDAADGYNDLLQKIDDEAKDDDVKGEANDESEKKRLRDKNHEIAILAKALLQKGSSLLTRTSEGRHLVASQTLQRPIVIGYRAMKMQPIDQGLLNPPIQDSKDPRFQIDKDCSVQP